MFLSVYEEIVQGSNLLYPWHLKNDYCLDFEQAESGHQRPQSFGAPCHMV